MNDEFDAVVVGAGPAGASAATLLARAGWSVALVERQRFPRRKVCGECIAASNWPLLDALGLGAAVDAVAGPPLERVALMRGDACVVAALPRAADPARRWGRALGRETLDTLLVAQARAAGVVVLQPWAVDALDGGPGAWRCVVRAIGAAGRRRLGEDDGVGDADAAVEAAGADTDADRGARAAPAAAARRAGAGRAGDGAADGARERGPARTDTGRPAHERGAAAGTRTLRAPVVVAAHGSWERLPGERAQRRAARGPADLLAFKAGFRGASLAEGLLPVLSFDGGYGGMVVGDRGVTTIACCIRRDRLDAARAAAPGVRAGDVVEALLRRACRGVDDALAGATRCGAWLAAGPLDPGVRVADDGGPFRIGNAAGEAHPIIGEGISMALQSAWLLCDRLVAGDARALDAAAQRVLARRHAAQWRRRFAPRLRLAAAFAHAAMHPAAAPALVALARAWPGLLTLGARRGGKTRCAVDASTIAGLGPARAPVPTPPRRKAAARRVQDCR